ncbi:MAG: hypothetical protein ACKO40_08540, partial [Planctomycetaceae bacterium]
MCPCTFAAWRLAVAIAFSTLAALPAAAVEPTSTLDGFLATKQIAAADRAALAAPGPWTADKERLLVRVVARMPAPAGLVAAWRRDAAPVAERGAATPVDDRLVVLRGRATLVAPLELPGELATLAGRGSYDLLRCVDDRGAVVDVVVPRAPRAWPRWTAIDEPVTVTGLPLAAGAGPVPAASASQPWPSTAADLLVAGIAVEWRPAGMLGGLGMDYALFDDVVDDRRLEAGDAAAFYAALAAVRDTTAGAVAAAAGGTTDLIPLIDPARKWFTTHRGDPVVVDGVARRATRIVIDDPDRRRQVGADHYWELEVFADTPPISIEGHVQDRYPVVCCVRELPDGMPRGETISERVRVPGFAFKRYRYPLPEVVVDGAEERPRGGHRSAPLIVAPRAEWIAPPSSRGLSDRLFWVFFGILGALAALFAASGWSSARAARRAEQA